MKIHTCLWALAIFASLNCALCRLGVDERVIVTDQSQKTPEPTSTPNVSADFKHQDSFKVDVKGAGLPFYGEYYTGYVPVNDETGSSLFYSLFSAGGNVQNRSTPSTLSVSAPLILWVQGGPGCSGWIGNLQELGPMNVRWNSTNKTSYVVNNPNSWNTDNHLLFIDQPINSGFSFGGKGEKQNNTVASSIYLENFLIKFFKLYPQLKDNAFYIAGESYAGHYIPAIAARLIENKLVNNITLAGIAIGDGLIAPEFQLVWDTFSYSAGLIDVKQRKAIAVEQTAAIQAINNKDWINANDHIELAQEILVNATGVDIDNFRQYSAGDDSATDPLGAWLNNSKVRTALNIDPNTIFNETCSSGVFKDYSADIPQDFSINITYVLNNNPSVKVLIYTGSDDIICNTIGQLNWIKRMDWVDITNFNIAPRQVWKLDNGTIAGTYRHYGQFTYAQVYKAGHLVPGDQPQSAAQMIKNFQDDSGVWQ